MKKNLLLVITLALVFVNLVLTGILAIVVIPEASKANELITKVASAIDLELEAGDADEATKVDMSQIDLCEIADDMTINLKKGADGEDHFAVVKVVISINKESDAYKDYANNFGGKESLVKDEINNIISKYTIDEIKDDTEGVQKEIVKSLNDKFGDGYVVDVGFSSATYQ